MIGLHVLAAIAVYCFGAGFTYKLVSVHNKDLAYEVPPVTILWPITLLVAAGLYLGGRLFRG